MPPNVPTSAAAPLWPISSGGPPSMPMAGQRFRHGVANKVKRVVIARELGILLEDLALVRFLDVGLQLDRAVLARVLKQLVQHFQVIEIEPL